ncbi:acyl-CoA dehydrogenase family protein [Tenacibaculum aiptasiae]|uniref:acyl-CoA dehydrogenase family protein n=1 Tax=Tenacibaculum aiptasiae TaxID=426481 RepID=UPI00232B356C|nr:acyl-CoA dehydrogenase family protein [Tenacibaculum aiptasiae]
MNTAVDTKKGGAFLFQNENLDTFYIPEIKSQESEMIQESAKQFLKTEIETRKEELETVSGIEETPELLKKCGELGFLGLEVSEEYGGINVSLKEVLHFVETFSKGHSFAGAIGVQTSIGIAPVLLYGSEFLKEKYVAKMMQGELISAFALTEPNAGSDANSGKTLATINENGDYVISGQKAWISNAGIADIFIVFAKIEDDKNLSAFVVDKDFGGISLGPEEKKMGLSGWSTRQVFLEKTVVPATHLLGERNKGLKIALNTLNTGRIKLGASCIGIGKKALLHSVEYALQREQFKKPIIDFGAIREKISKITTNIFVNEAIVYRVANDIDMLTDELAGNGMAFSNAKIEALKEYSIECAIAKVYGSEVQDTIVDESVQIYGGMGFSAESPVEHLYRSARISRIFEGTNEINRLVIIKEFLKKGMKGELDFFSPYTQITSGLSNPIESFSTDVIEQYEQVVQNLKDLTVITSGVCMQTFMAELAEEQEISMHIADLLINVYALESVLLRIKKLQKIGKLDTSIHYAILKIVGFDSFNSVENSIKNLVASFDNEKDAEIINSAFKKYGHLPHYNIKNERRTVCSFVQDTKGVYSLN